MLWGELDGQFSLDRFGIRGARATTNPTHTPWPTLLIPTGTIISFPKDLWRHDPRPIPPREHPDIEEGEGEDFYTDEDQSEEPRPEYHDARSGTISMSYPDANESTDALDIRSRDG